jgi:predicted acylesterase/phospholipase RssA
MDVAMSAQRAVTSSRPTVGLVLGAGGVRGCAHAGAIRVLHEAGVPIDYLVGTSVGSIFGLALAAGIDPAHPEQVIRRSSTFDMMRFYAGRLRTDRNNPIARLVREAGDGRTFEDLERPLTVMATDMEANQVVAFDRGPVLPAIEASIAVPFVARPAEIDGRYYVDGGILDTAPVYIARRMGADIVIAVCLGGNFRAPAYIRNRPWARAVVERVGSSGRAGTRLSHQIRYSAGLFAATYDPVRAGADADIAIWPSFGMVRPNSMFGTRFCLEQGIRATEAAVPQILELLRDREVIGSG